MKLNNRELMDERFNDSYIAGFVHGDGGFSVQLALSKTTKSKRIRLIPMFTLTQHIRNLELIKKIIKRIGNVGSYSVDNKNIMRYRLSKIIDFKEKLIPFFDENQVKKDKLTNYIKLKFIVEKLLTIDNRFRWFSYDLENDNNKLMFDLIIISINMNNHVKPSINLKQFTLKDQKRILNNELSLKILEELNNYILNYNYKKDLNIDFINGLFDSDGWITLRLSSRSKLKNSIFIGCDYGIVSDLLNKELLYDIKSFFNNVGIIRERTDEKSVSYLVAKTECISEILPKIYNVSNYWKILDNNNNNKTKGPIIKDNKIKVILKIFGLYEEYKKINKIEKDKRNLILEKILILSYEIREINLKNKESLDDYLIRMREKLTKKLKVPARTVPPFGETGTPCGAE